MKSTLATAVSWLLFVAGLAACVGSRFVLPAGWPQPAATYAGTALSLVTGAIVLRKDPIRTWLATRPVLRFLFLFNMLVAAAAGVFVPGVPGVMAAAGMGAVSLGAGFGLLRARRTAAAG